MSQNLVEFQVGVQVKIPVDKKVQKELGISDSDIERLLGKPGLAQRWVKGIKSTANKAPKKEKELATTSTGDVVDPLEKLMLGTL